MAENRLLRNSTLRLQKGTPKHKSFSDIGLKLFLSNRKRSERLPWSQAAGTDSLISTKRPGRRKWLLRPGSERTSYRGRTQVVETLKYDLPKVGAGVAIAYRLRSMGYCAWAMLPITSPSCNSREHTCWLSGPHK